MPFAKVPMNVAQTGIDYTTGLVKGTAEIISIIKDAKNGKAIPVERQRQAVSDFGRGATGAVMLSVITAAAFAGVIRADDGEDWDKKALEQAEGRSGAQINWSALLRGLKGESTDWQYGDVVSELDFLEPFNTMMYLGYEVSQAEDIGDYATAPMKSIFSALMDSPMMTGLQDVSDLFEGFANAEDAEDYAQVTAEFAGSLASSFVPQPVRQAAQLADGYYRDTKGATPGETALNQLLASIPGLSQTLPMKYSGLGEPQKRHWTSDLFDVTNTKRLTLNEVTQHLDAIYEQTGIAGIYPDRQAPKEITVNGEKIPVIGEAREKYQKEYGEKSNALYTELMSGVGFDLLTPEQKADALKKAEAKATEFAKAAVSNYEKPEESTEQISTDIMRSVLASGFTKAVDAKDAQEMDEAYNLYQQMPEDVRQLVDEEGGKIKYFITARNNGIDSNTFIQLHTAYKAIDDTENTAAEKQRQWTHELQNAAENGTISEEQKAALSDAMRFWQVIPAKAQKYNEMTDRGISGEKALYISEIMDGIEPEAGKTTVAYWQQAEAITGAKLTNSEKVKALKVYGNDTQDENITQMLKSGYDADDYVAAYIIYREEKNAGGAGTKDRIIEQLRKALGVSKSKAKQIYEIFNG